MKVVKKEEAKEKKKQKPTAADSKRCNADTNGGGCHQGGGEMVG